MPQNPRDHGGDLDTAIATYGGTRATWVDLSTGINPVPYPLADCPQHAWTSLPDFTAQARLEHAARRAWSIPDDMAVLAAPGASAIIARLPSLCPPGRVDIPEPTYNEHAAAFAAHSWTFGAENPDARVIVNPNNPTGHWYTPRDLTAPLVVVDESFADIAPERSLLPACIDPGQIVLKSFGKFWGLAGLRLGFAIGQPDPIERLADLIGPWPVSGPALTIATTALQDTAWADATRARLATDAARLDQLMQETGAQVVGGTSLFRLYKVKDAKASQAQLATHNIWTRIFPYSDTWLRMGLPGPAQWSQIERAV